jgi:hypothetical protein
VDGKEDVMVRDEPEPDCDCGDSVRHERDMLRVALASISEEMGLPPNMGPAKGDLKRRLDQGKAAIDKWRDAPLAVSVEADFESLTWTFRITPTCRVGPGVYALVWIGPNETTHGSSQHPA